MVMGCAIGEEWRGAVQLLFSKIRRILDFAFVKILSIFVMENESFRKHLKKNIFHYKLNQFFLIHIFKKSISF